MNKGSDYTWDDYARHVAELALPWMTVALVGLLILVLALVYLFCRCLCCRRSLKRSSRCMVKSVFACSLFFVCMSLLCFALALQYTDVVFQSYQQIQCFTVSLPNDIIYGNGMSNWKGTEQTQIDLEDLKDTAGDYDMGTIACWRNSDFLDDLGDLRITYTEYVQQVAAM